MAFTVIGETETGTGTGTSNPCGCCGVLTACCDPIILPTLLHCLVPSVWDATTPEFDLVYDPDPSHSPSGKWVGTFVNEDLSGFGQTPGDVIQLIVYCSFVNELDVKFCYQLNNLTTAANIVSQSCTSLFDFDCSPFYADMGDAGFGNFTAYE